MRATIPGGVGLLPGGLGGGTRVRRTSDWLYSAFVMLVVIAAMVAVVAGLSTERRALRAMPAQERAALVARTVDELRQLCGPGKPPALKDHCRELASFAAQFDECQGECEALVRHELTPAPTR